jgi:hydrogenase maturation protein HypF
MRKQIVVKGMVQGVGFRPFVWRLASELACTGSVCNDSNGVKIEIQGPPVAIEEFQRRLMRDAPSLSRIAELISVIVPKKDGETTFSIFQSIPSERPVTFVAPDVSVCADCLKELHTPTDRRFGYPFINCTNCGPRFTIIQALPYDRQRTTMSVFTLCDDCQLEYSSPTDRRFHAEPNACHVCGPKIWFTDARSPNVNSRMPAEFELDVQMERSRTRKAIEHVQSKIADGEIIAIKGVGGFHLACDARNIKAVSTLRTRKRRPDKPLAVMVADLDTCRQFAILHESEARILLSRERPIVLLQKNSDADWVEALSPGNPHVGIMLAYSPLHHLLVRPGQVWVMTSGNVADEPIAIHNDDAWLRLQDIADGFLFHNRPIHTVCDDSVLRLRNTAVLPIRRSRGFAPLEIRLVESTSPLEQDRGLSEQHRQPTVLAIGGEIKATVCLAIDSHAFLSQHIGDMGHEESLKMLEHVSGHLLDLYQVRPQAIAADQHPGYLSVMWAQKLARFWSIPLLQFQHHHAHAASLIAEHRLASQSQIIACIFDGTGYGTDGAIWGGEWLIASLHSFRRFAHLRNISLPGGDACILRPARSALAHLFRYSIPWNESLPSVQSLSATERRLLKNQLEKGLLCSETSSMGRLFDAVASLIGVRQEIRYEGQAAMELESMATKAIAIDNPDLPAYPFRWDQGTSWELHCDQVLRHVIADYEAGVAPGLISAQFHETLSQATLEICMQARSETGLNIVGLTGGVFQNTLLTHLIQKKLECHEFQVLTHRIVPPNDAGIALGQAVLAREQLRPEFSRSR